jgi:hypothetical protein
MIKSKEKNYKLDLKIYAIGQKIPSAILDKEITQKALQLSRKIFATNLSKMDEIVFKNAIYLHVVNGSNQSLNDLANNIIYERNSFGKTTRYMRLNSNSQKLHIEQDVVEWFEIIHQIILKIIEQNTL